MESTHASVPRTSLFILFVTAVSLIVFGVSTMTASPATQYAAAGARSLGLDSGSFVSCRGSSRKIELSTSVLNKRRTVNVYEPAAVSLSYVRCTDDGLQVNKPFPSTSPSLKPPRNHLTTPSGGSRVPGSRLHFDISASSALQKITMGSWSPSAKITYM